jgi:hypothetical protein
VSLIIPIKQGELRSILGLFGLLYGCPFAVP